MCACAGDLTLQYDTDGIQHATSWDTGAEQNISRPQETKVTSLVTLCELDPLYIKKNICTLIHKYICFLQCDVTTGVEASDKKLFLCLSFKSFLEHDILKG